MAKQSMINREVKRAKTVERYAAKRAELKEANTGCISERGRTYSGTKQFHRLPRDASPCRLRNRCRITGRPHGYYRKFGLARNKLREHAMLGNIPGLVKSSW